MARVIVEMDISMDEFETLSKEDQTEAIKEVLDSGAESTCSYISVESITFKD